MKSSILNLGGAMPVHGAGDVQPAEIPAPHLVTHGVILGMTGSGKTGLATVLVEEALRAKVPVLAIDIKGDLPNLLLTLPTQDPAAYLPWVDTERATRGGVSPEDVAEWFAIERGEELAEWTLGDADVASFANSIAPRVLTPGTSAGELVHVLSSLERPSPLWEKDPEAARAALSASISLVLRLVGRDADPARSRDHVVLSRFAEARLRHGRAADLASLLHDLANGASESRGLRRLRRRARSRGSQKGSQNGFCGARRTDVRRDVRRGPVNVRETLARNSSHPRPSVRHAFRVLRRSVPMRSRLNDHA